MRYSIEPTDQIYGKGYGLLYFSENMGINLSRKYGKKFIFSINSLQRMHSKLLQKGQFKERKKQQVI